MHTEEALKLFLQLKRKFGSHAEVARQLRLPLRTYADWRKRGLASAEKWARVIPLLRSLLEREERLPSGFEEAFPRGSDRRIQVAFDKMPLSDFIHHIFSDVLAVNYHATEQVLQMQRPITINLKQTTSERHLLMLARDILSQEGLDVSFRDGLFYIGPSSGNRKTPPL